MVPVLLHRVPDFLIIVLSGWLGLSLLVRAPRSGVIRTFAWLCVLLVFYSISAVQAQLTTSQSVLNFLQREHLAAVVLTPAAFLHVLVMLAYREHIRPPHVVLVTLFYTMGIALALYAAFAPLREMSEPFPPWTTGGEPRFPPGPLTWLAVVQRVVPVVVGLWLMRVAYQRVPLETLEWRQHRFLWGAALLGGAGGLGATLARELVVSPAFPRLLIVAALLVLIYAAIAHRVMLPSRLAQRAFLYTLLGSLLTVVYLSLAIVLEWISGRLLDIHVPLVTIISILGLAIAFGPVGEWMRSQIDRRFYPREFDYRRLLKSLSDELFERGGLNDQLQAALSLICRALDVREGLVLVVEQQGMATRAAYGEELYLDRQKIPRSEQEYAWGTRYNAHTRYVSTRRQTRNSIFARPQAMPGSPGIGL